MSNSSNSPNNPPTPPNNPSNSPNNPPTPPNNPSNSPNNSSTPSNNPPNSHNRTVDIRLLVKAFYNLITNDKLANFLSILPYLAGGVVFLAPTVLLIQNWYSDTLNAQNPNEDKDFKTKICKNYERLVQERLEIEGNRNASISKISSVDNKNNSKINQLPFSCEYQILEGNKNLEPQEIYLELSPLFPDLTNEINNDFEEKINLQQVCKHETVIQQMEEKATKQGFYKKDKGDRILPGRPVLLETKKDVYPVFRWVCSYEIKKQGEEEDFQGRNTYNIDIKLEPYCESKAEQEEIKRVKPTYHNYKDPYSLYCVNPHAKNKK